MSTNYYARRSVPTCPTCNHTPKDLHIGKSSVGWCFALHVDPGESVIPADLAGWQALLERDEWTIVDEYERPMTLPELLTVIAGRSSEKWWPTSEGTRGPRNMVRRNISDHCIGHGAGTWDLCVGEFS